MRYPIQVKTSSGTVITIQSDTEYTRRSSATGAEKAHTCLFWGAATHRGVALQKVLGNHPLVFAVAVPDENYGGHLVREFESARVTEINGVAVIPVLDGGEDAGGDDEGPEEAGESEAQPDGTGEAD